MVNELVLRINELVAASDEAQAGVGQECYSEE